MREITHTLLPRRDTLWSRQTHPTGCYHELRSAPMASRDVFIFVLSPGEVAAEVKSGEAVVVPTTPRMIFDYLTGAKSALTARPA